MNIDVFFQQMVILAILIGVGFTIRKLKIIDKQSNVTLSRLLLKITVPATLISSISGRDLDASRGDLPWFFLMIIIAFAVMGIVSWIATRAMCVPKLERGAYINMGLFSNVNFMSIPIIANTLAPHHPNAMLYGILYNIIFNLTIFSMGMKFIGGKEAKLDWKLFCSPLMISALFAVVLFVMDLSLPTVINTSLSHLGALTAPVAMMLLGSTLAEMDIKEVFQGWRVYGISLVRLIIAPVAAYFVLLPIGLEPILFQSIIVMSVTPMAISVVMFTINYDIHQKIVGKGIFISTILSLATVPLLLFALFGRG